MAELGGVGAAAPLVGGLFSSAMNGWRESLILARNLNKEAADLENANNVIKLKELESGKLGKQVVWMIVFTSLAVLSAGVWVPVLGILIHIVYALCDIADQAPTIAVVWYWPTQGSFLFFEWENLKTFTVGPKNATYTIAILPSFISMSANAVSFFMMNRVRKKLY